jgi:hypothetical protein
MNFEIDGLILGESDDIIETSSSDEVREATLAITQQAKKSLNIFTHTLDSRIYNNQALYDAVLKLATYSRYSLIRIIIKDSTSIVKQGNRLAELSHRISSRVQIRNPPLEFQDNTEEFVLADERGLMHRPVTDRYNGELCFNATTKGRQLLKYFDDCWKKSAPDPELRRLHI